jgi:hypothetical protein
LRFICQRASVVAIAVVIVLGAGVIALARPHMISEPALGAEWQCTRVAFVVTCDHRRDGALIPIRGLDHPASVIARVQW